MPDDIVTGALVRTRLRDLRPEAELLLAAARRRITEDQQERIHAFLTESAAELDWGFFLDQACRHGVLPMVGRNLAKLRLTHSADGRALAPYRWIYAYAYDGNRRRNVALGDEYAKVIRGLNAAGVDYAIRKGPVLTEGVYHDIGLRRMGDLDILLSRGDLPRLAAVAEDLGYVQGHLSRNAERVVPFDRRTTLTWTVSVPNSTLPFLKPAQRDDVETFVLDPCFDLFQPRSGIRVDVAQFLARTRRTVAFGEPTRMLDEVDQVIDACVQLHVEATTLMYIELGKDLTLLKFLDLEELLRTLSRPQSAAFVERVHALGCQEAVRYALHHAAQIHPDDVPEELVGAFEVTDPAGLDRYGDFDGTPQRWERGFSERLFDPRRSRSLSVHSAVPGPRAVV